MTNPLDQIEVRGDPEILRMVRGPNSDSCPEPERSANIDHIGLDDFVARANCMYTRYGLSPPFALRETAGRWRRAGVPFQRCLSSIERFLIDHAGSCHSGSGDYLFEWLDRLIRGERQPQTLPSRSPREIISNRSHKLHPMAWMGLEEDDRPQSPEDWGQSD